MTLSPGTRIGSYEVVHAIGVGGMGEVYRARDTRLERNVAVKVLTSTYVHDPDSLARFEREARLLASLNHPHIAAIYGVEQFDGTDALILELVEGETLAEQIRTSARGAGLRMNEALTIARQIADALDAAHEKGIVHRDLKPANIKVTPDGVVKVLDFGIAKLAPDAGTAASTTAEALAVTQTATSAGLILGTAAYMSPEQARGHAVDKRTDIWAFGCVLYEMLTGRAAFARDTITDTLAFVVERDPDWTVLPESTPPSVRQLLRQCLKKSPKERLRDIGDVLPYIDDEAIDTRQLSDNLGSSRKWQLATGVLILALLPTLMYLMTRTNTHGQRAARFFPVATDAVLEHSPSWSPDGRALAYVSEVGNVAQIFTKSLSATVAQQITKCAVACEHPFWATDGNRVYYNSANRLWSIGAAGGEPQVVIEDADVATASKQAIAFLRGRGGSRSLWITANAGAKPERYRTPPFPETFTRSWSVEFSNDGSKLALLIEIERDDGFASELWILPYPAGTPRRLATRREISTQGLLKRLSWEPDNRHLVIADESPGQGSHLFRVDTETGAFEALSSGVGEERTPSVSPDGGRIAFTSGASDADVVQVSLDGSNVQPLLTSDRSELDPAWLPSGNRFVYITNMRGMAEIWSRAPQEQWSIPVLTDGIEGLPTWYTLGSPVVSADGQRVAYFVNTGRRHAIWISPLAGGRSVSVDRESYDQHGPAWSPDGNWIAYQRLHAAKWEVVKTPLGGGASVRLADTGAPGGGSTAWSRSGEWVAYLGANGLELVAADGSSHRVLAKWRPAAFAFSNDSRQLYALRRADEWELVTVDIPAGTERAIAVRLPATATVTGFSVHPDGRSFVTSLGTRKYDIWVRERSSDETSR